MSLHAFFLEDGKRRVSEAVASVERRTSAEVLVCVQRISGSYRHADYVGGAILALALLCLFLYYPEPFDYTFFPLEQAAGFAFGAFVTATTPPLRKLLAGKSAVADAVHKAARAAFVDRKVGRTRARNGVLVFVSTFELAVEVVADVGIDVDKLGEPWKDALKKLDRAVRREHDPAKFAAAIEELGTVLAREFPGAADDLNELVDHVATDDEAPEEETP
ncbi:MAG: hypothetical protein HOW73_34340 [Polyangiaceae bacterium]|nr:hypothetical protein [Polyangiaceae bacterium]